MKIASIRGVLLMTAAMLCNELSATTLSSLRLSGGHMSTVAREVSEHSSVQCISSSASDAPQIDAPLLQAEILRKLSASSLLQTVTVQVECETAYLDGSVKSQLAKEHAGELARSVEGVRYVVNRIEVDGKFSVRPIK